MDGIISRIVDSTGQVLKRERIVNCTRCKHTSPLFSFSSLFFFGGLIFLSSLSLFLSFHLLTFWFNVFPLFSLLSSFGLKWSSSSFLLFLTPQHKRPAPAVGSWQVIPAYIFAFSFSSFCRNQEMKDEREKEGTRLREWKMSEMEEVLFMSGSSQRLWFFLFIISTSSSIFDHNPRRRAKE